MREIVLTNHLADKIREYSEYRPSVLAPNIGLRPPWLRALFDLFSGAGQGQRQQAAIYRLGATGESRLKGLLRETLSDEFVCFSGFPTRRNGDIDCLILGPTGLYAVEVKHHNGVVALTSRGWVQIKKGKSGVAYQGQLQDPGKQLMRSVYDLKDCLEKQGVAVYIQAVVVFTHSDVSLHLRQKPRSMLVCRLDEFGEALNTKGRTWLKHGQRAFIERAILNEARKRSMA